VTVSPRERLPDLRGRQTQAVMDAAARAVIARKGFLASSYNYDDSKDWTVREWVQRFLADAHSSVRATGIERAQQHRYRPDDEPKLTAPAGVSMLNQFCYYQFTGDGSAETVDDEAVPT